jgi:hypothetical protein
MAWTTPPAFTVGQVLGAASLNAMSADLTDLDSRTRPSNNVIASSQTTTSTSYTDLATPGPAVTKTTGVLAMVVITAEVDTTGAGVSPYMSFAVTGASSVAATDANAIRVDSSAIVNVAASYAFLVIVTAGSNVFTAKYRVGSGTGTFVNRSMIVWPGGNLS